MFHHHHLFSHSLWMDRVVRQEGFGVDWDIRESSDPFDWTRELLLQDRIRRLRMQADRVQTEQAFRKRVLWWIPNWLPCCTLCPAACCGGSHRHTRLSLGTACCIPSFFERRLDLHPGDIVEVSRRQRHWAFGMVVESPVRAATDPIYTAAVKREGQAGVDDRVEDTKRRRRFSRGWFPLSVVSPVPRPADFQVQVQKALSGLTGPAGGTPRISGARRKEKKTDGLRKRTLQASI